MAVEITLAQFTKMAIGETFTVKFSCGLAGW